MVFSMKDLGYFEEITLKAFANFSPGFALKPWELKTLKKLVATLKELRRDCDSREDDATLSGLRLEEMHE